MRARRFELRLLGGGLVAAWAVAAALVLLAYRPGGPLDVVVGVTMLAPLAIAIAGVIWPPLARGRGAFPLMVTLGVGVLLLLVPSIGGILNQLMALGTQTLMPSPEAAYPWLLALLGTSLFSGFGIARRLQGGSALRRRRLLAGTALAVLLTLGAGSLFAGAAIANEVALQRDDVAPSGSRFGPTTASGDPPDCDAGLGVGATARLAARFTAAIDGRPTGSVDLVGIRRGEDVRWLAYVATDRQLGQYGVARSGDRSWTRDPDRGWTSADPAAARDATVDLHALDVALIRDYRVTAEEHGIEVIEGARARHCRIGLDGATFRAAFPQLAWLVGDADLGRWRGQLDYWIFLDGQLGQLAGSVNGEAAGLETDALQGTIEVFLTATERGRDIVIYPPAP
ncbi:MAG TPA: hypothetical protein VD763_00855 [Candidatus Saccharimonadales bacterium]|nr:hypothetical protein [Candidatus Saccharimonadales bacterium]